MILQAILLGIIEGLTEFLPVSSTGHLLVAEKAINYHDTAEIFTVVIQMGAIAAVIWYYRQDLWQKAKGLLRRDTEELRFWRNVVIATIPASAVGLIIEGKMDRLATLPVVGVALIVGGVLMWLIEAYHQPKHTERQQRLNKLTLKQAGKVGCYQVLSLVPGVSRSGATIMGGLLSGLDRVTATAFSFYLSIPILVMAGGYKLIKNRQELATVDGGSTALLVGLAAAFLTALFVVKWLIHYVSKHDFKPFAYYRIVLGSLILIALALH